MKSRRSSQSSRTAVVQSFQAEQKASRQGGALVSFVYTERFGARATLSKDLLGEVEAEDTVCMGYDDTGIYIGSVIDRCNEYTLRDGGRSKMNVYCKPLIEEIAVTFSLDYEARSTYSFYDVEYLEIDGYTVAFIPVTASDDPDVDEEE